VLVLLEQLLGFLVDLVEQLTCPLRSVRHRNNRN
jgi:hypothetical protein